MIVNPGKFQAIITDKRKQDESSKWRAQRAHVLFVPYVPARPTCSTCPMCPRALHALRAHVPKYILQTGKLKNGNFVLIRF